jgi:hypothetical protein
MAVGIYMANQITAAKYDEAMRKLNQAGASAPKGRTYHAAFFEGETLSVFDVWDSMADFEAFGATLGPILQELGVETPEPQVSEVHNIVAG